MTTNTRSAATLAAFLLAVPASAEGILVHDAYARVSSMMSTSGAAFMMIHNESGQPDHLIDAHSDAAKRVELHTHVENADGVMRMVHVEDGFDLPAGGMIAMQRGGAHVMLMGLKEALGHGDTVKLTLLFKHAGEVTVDVPVDLKRKAMHGGMKHDHMNHGQMNHGQMSSD